MGDFKRRDRSDSSKTEEVTVVHDRLYILGRKRRSAQWKVFPKAGDVENSVNTTKSYNAEHLGAVLGCEWQNENRSPSSCLFLHPILFYNSSVVFIQNILILIFPWYTEFVINNPLPSHICLAPNTVWFRHAIQFIPRQRIPQENLLLKKSFFFHRDFVGCGRSWKGPGITSFPSFSFKVRITETQDAKWWK